MTILTAIIPDEMAGMRLDQVLSQLFSDYSRSKLQTWIKAGRVTVNGQSPTIRKKIDGGEQVQLNAEPEAILTCEPENIGLEIIFEDKALLIVNKPAGLVVHPGAGNWTGTLQNALLYHYPSLNVLPRAGIIHRIDKDTSGLLMIAKTLAAHHHLTDQLQARTIEREYLAIVRGWMTAGGTIDQPIGRHPHDRIRYAVNDKGKTAITHYWLVQHFKRHSLVRVKLETGRTHQIRVHMQHLHYPLVGDPLYGGNFQLPADCNELLAIQLRAFKRQALHATKLGLIHPFTDQKMIWKQPLPTDMQTLLDALIANE
jgi:23S rRNA pseudouridine1911/1915/1917 synthase